MPTIEEKIKGFLRERGITLMGIAGPERWKNGPPSIDPTYILPGAKSIIAWAVPFNAPAIYDFLSKKSPGPHNFDQLKLAQRITEIIGKTVVLKPKVDPKIIGGIIIRVGDKLIDGSIRSKLAALRKDLGGVAK